MTSHSQSQGAGYAVLELKPSPAPPSNGTCEVIITKVLTSFATDDKYDSVIALTDKVSILCSNWIDNSNTNSSLEYHIYVNDSFESGPMQEWYPVYRGSRANATFYLSPFRGEEGQIDIIVEVIDSYGSETQALKR